MKKLIIAATLLMLAACDGSPAQRQVEADKLQAHELPVAIAKVGGVTLYKVKDNTSGGTSYVYFTAPCGDANWRQQHGKTSIHHTVPGPTCE